VDTFLSLMLLAAFPDVTWTQEDQYLNSEAPLLLIMSSLPNIRCGALCTWRHCVAKVLGEVARRPLDFMPH
uniref:Uncharacterized protein n=1 Tax=Marmota marmota marmota TaxID=9994 RepID=A0A8C5ZYM4_MARMA